jgi:hypothetical protein
MRLGGSWFLEILSAAILAGSRRGNPLGRRALGGAVTPDVPEQAANRGEKGRIEQVQL